MSFKNTPTLRSRRRFYFTDGPGTMRPDPEDCDCAEGRDAGRIRFAKAPESNHYGGGEFRDVHNPDPQSERTEAEWTDPRTASGGSGPAYRGSRPPKNATNVGALGQPVIEARQDGKVGLAGTAAYDPRTNTTTTGKDPTLLGSTSARNVGALKPDGMGSRAETTADVIKRINQRNKRFYARDADPDDTEREDEEGSEPPTPLPDNTEPSVTRHTRENPDGSKVIVQHEIHPPRTVDLRMPRRQPVLSGTRDNDATQYGTLRAQGVRRGVTTIAEINRLNREKWGK